MVIYIVFSNYFDSGMFSAYSSVKRARIAFGHFITEDEDILAFEELDGYSYQFTTANGETFNAEITFDVLDTEFVEGICEED